jgi:hypothetical protein
MEELNKAIDKAMKACFPKSDKCKELYFDALRLMRSTKLQYSDYLKAYDTMGYIWYHKIATERDRFWAVDGGSYTSGINRSELTNNESDKND